MKEIHKRDIVEIMKPCTQLLMGRVYSKRNKIYLELDKSIQPQTTYLSRVCISGQRKNRTPSIT